METKSLLFGLIGFFLGGLIVSAAATFDKQNVTDQQSVNTTQMADSLKAKYSDEFDKAFIAGMITHHKGAIDMAKLAEGNAKHDEIKQLSREIITAQEAEIEKMKQWQGEWGYSSNESMQSGHMGH